MKPLVIGAGLMGSTFVEFLLRSPEVEKVHVVDYDVKSLKRLADKYGDRVDTTQVDLSKKEQLVAVMKQCTIAISAAPLIFNVLTTEAAIEAGISMIDLSAGDIESRLALNEEAKKKGVIIVPGCGVAPGLTNILAGSGSAQLDTVDDIIIRVGGFPENPKPPLGYSISWSLESLIDEYIAGAHILRNGEIIKVPALDGFESIEFDGVGTLESFISEGLSTLPYTMKSKGVKNIEERTLRYPGHIEKIKTLYDCGLFDFEEIDVKGTKVLPVDVTTAVLGRKLFDENDTDMLALRVNVTGLKDGKHKEIVYEMVDRYDKKDKISAMGRTTTLPAIIIAKLVDAGVLTETGVVSSEICIGQNEVVFNALVEQLATYGVNVVTKIK